MCIHTTPTSNPTSPPLPFSLHLAYKKKSSFDWKDPLLLHSQLSEEENAIRENVQNYCQTQLFPRVLQANRHESFDPQIMKEMGKLGMLGTTIEGYGCLGANNVIYGLIAREVER